MPSAAPSLNDLADQARQLAARLGVGARSASRSLPIRCSPDEVQRTWHAQRTAILDGIPVGSARLVRGADQGEWGTTWSIRLQFTAPLPTRAAQTLAGKAVRRLKAAAETGEIPTTAHNPAYRPGAGQDGAPRRLAGKDAASRPSAGEDAAARPTAGEDAAPRATAGEQP